MNINGKIDWKAGMEISAQTFLELDENITRRQQIASRAVNGNQFGLIPFTEFRNDAGLVRNKLEIEHMLCMALLPSGKILHIDEEVVVPIPLVYGEVYYLACEFGEEEVKYDIKEVPFTRPEHVYGIYPLEEIEGTDRFPLMRFKVSDGIFAIDDSYILPCLHLSSDERFQAYIDRFADKMNVLAEHPNLESGEAKRSFKHFAFLLNNYSLKNRTQQFVQLTNEIAQTIDFYVMTPNTETKAEIPACSEYDIIQWLDWLDEYLHSAATILDQVVLEDHSIDFDELKAQIKAELYEQLYPELKEILHTELKEELQQELTDDLMLKLTDYINNRFKEDLHGLLSGELSEELYERLYDALYNAIYNALYVPEEEEVFTPMI